MMALPRVLLTSHLLGRPMGNPFDMPEKINILTQAVDLLTNADKNGTIADAQ